MSSWSNCSQSTFFLVSFFLCPFSALCSLGYTLYNAGARKLFPKFNVQFTISRCNCGARSCDIKWCQKLKYRNGGKPFPNLICKLKLRSKSSTSCNVELWWWLHECRNDGKKIHIIIDLVYSSCNKISQHSLNIWEDWVWKGFLYCLTFTGTPEDKIQKCDGRFLMNFTSAIDNHDNDGDNHDRDGDNLVMKE